MGREVWITGIGLVSSLGEGLDAHWRALAEALHPKPNVDLAFAPPFGIHPMVPLDLDTQIPKKSDQRQMEPWQRLGTYAAGLALSNAGIAGNLDILSHTHAVVAADGGERDVPTDTAILGGLHDAAEPASFLNEHLSNDLRPTLFLAQLPTLVAGNISIVHKVTGSSRTFMGEEIAGVSATEIAWRRIGAGQGDIFLVGGACIAERKDSILNCALGGTLWAGPHLPIWERLERGGGAMLGSVGAFLVLEAREHAEARGRKPYARILDIRTDQSRRRPGDVAAKLTRQFDAVAPAGSPPVSVLSAATGMAVATREEHDLIAGLIAAGRVDTVRAVASMLGAATSATSRQRRALQLWRLPAVGSTGQSTGPAWSGKRHRRSPASSSPPRGCGAAKARR
ncbi:MAG: beta-ketoacyl-ACP synthase [Allosphingosinicella sp.]